MPPNYPQQAPPPTQPSNYDFIMNPGQPPKKSRLPKPTSLVARIGLIGGGLIVLFILFAIVKSIVIKGPDYTQYVTVAQDQQELIHLLNNATSSSQQTLSTTNQNFAATAKLSLSSNQYQILQYLSKNGQKINAKVLAMKIDSQVDTQLSNAQTAGTYDSAFQTTMKNELDTYLKDLSGAYNASSSKQQKGRALLKNLYSQAKLLQSQVSSASN